MAKDPFAGADASRLRDLLRKHPGHEHLDVASRGKHLTIFTTGNGEPVPLARLTALPRDEYGLSLMWHTGRWQRMPILGTIEDVVEELVQCFPDFLAP